MTRAELGLMILYEQFALGTLKHDHRKQLDNLIREIGDDAIAMEEPEQT